MTPTPANDNRPQQRPKWFDDLLLKYDPYIRARCSANRHNADDAEDLYQDVQLRAVERWYRYNRDGNFAGWIFYLVREVMGLTARKDERAAKYPPYHGARVVEPSQEYAADISKAVSMMTEPQRDAIVAVSIGCTLTEAGTQLEVTKQRAWQIIGRGRELLAANDNEQAAPAEKPRLRA